MGWKGTTVVREIPPDLWTRASSSRARLLGLDYDGTIAPLRADRDAAAPLEGIPEILHALARGTRTELAIVSGRPIAQLDRFLPGLDAHFAGEHGWEMRPRGGLAHGIAPPRPALAVLERATRAASGLAGSRAVERKACSVVLHTRGLAPEAGRALERACGEAWAALAGESGGVAIL
jgi:trehalose-phosphatase